MTAEGSRKEAIERVARYQEQNETHTMHSTHVAWLHKSQTLHAFGHIIWMDYLCMQQKLNPGTLHKGICLASEATCP